jgi:hypothetical protein
MATASKYNPTAIRRCVRIADVAPDGIIVFTTKSFTKADVDDKWNPLVDVQTGAVSCSCPDFTYRKAKNHPHLHSEDAALCKHLLRCRANLRRRGFIG